MQSRRQFLGTMAAAAALPSVLLSAPARAQTLLRQLTVIVGYPAGGGTDVIARLVSDSLRGTYAESVVVENRSGAGGRIGAEYVKRAAPDGQTMLFTPAFPMLIYPHVYKNMGYDTLTDFTPVAMTHRGILALSVGPAVPESVKTVHDFAEWCKAHPDQANFAASAGSAQHFAGVLFARSAGIPLQMIDYKGGAPEIVDCMGGHIASIITALSEVTPYMNGGKLRLLATTGSKRSPAAPNVPTFVELGYKEVLFQDWSGFLAPAHTPMDLVQRANAIVSKAVFSEKISATMLTLGAPAAATTPEAFAAEIKTGWERYKGIVKSTGFVADE